MLKQTRDAIDYVSHSGHFSEGKKMRMSQRFADAIFWTLLGLVALLCATGVLFG